MRQGWARWAASGSLIWTARYHTCMHVSNSRHATDAGRAPRHHARRAAGGGGPRPLPRRLRQPDPRAGRGRGRLHARRAVPPVRRTRRSWRWRSSSGSAATWEDEVWEPAQREPDPVAVLIALARGHIVFCRRDVARVMMALRMEFDRREHPVGRAVREVEKRNLERLASADRGRPRATARSRPGPPLAAALLGAIEGLAMVVAGRRTTRSSPSASPAGCSARRDRKLRSDGRGAGAVPRRAVGERPRARRGAARPDAAPAQRRARDRADLAALCAAICWRTLTTRWWPRAAHARPPRQRGRYLISHAGEVEASLWRAS